MEAKQTPPSMYRAGVPNSASEAVSRFDNMLAKLDHIAKKKRESLVNVGASEETVRQFEKALEKKKAMIEQEKKKAIEMEMTSVM